MHHRILIEVVPRVLGCIFHLLCMAKELGHQALQKGVEFVFLLVLDTKSDMAHLPGISSHTAVAADAQSVRHQRPLRLEYRLW